LGGGVYLPLFLCTRDFSRLKFGLDFKQGPLSIKAVFYAIWHQKIAFILRGPNFEVFYLFSSFINLKLSREMNKMTMILWLFMLISCKKTPTEITNPYSCEPRPIDKPAALFVETFNNATKQEVRDSSVFLTKVVGNWAFVFDKRRKLQENCDTYLLADSTHQITINFKSDFTFSWKTTDTLLRDGKMLGTGKIDSTFHARYNTSDIEFAIYAVNGDKLHIGINSFQYYLSYFKKL
jgi:hypothetical protein